MALMMTSSTRASALVLFRGFIGPSAANYNYNSTRLISRHCPCGSGSNRKSSPGVLPRTGLRISNGNIAFRTYGSRANNKPITERLQRLAIEDMEDEQREIQERLALEREQRKQQNIPSIQELVESDPAFQSPDYFQVHDIFTVRDLLDARVHLGHKVGSLNPRMMDFVFGSRFDSVIFDLDKTAFHLRQALNFVAHIAYRKGIILFVTRAPNTMHLVEQTAIECGEYAHCRDWHTHIMTNSENKFGGITRLPDTILFMNTLDNVLAPHGAVFDANKMLIPTVGIVDSNCDPNLITYPVPGNDDTITAVQFYCKVFKEAILRGKQKRKSLETEKAQVEDKKSSVKEE